MTTKRVHVLVGGQVQGVGYRNSARAETARLGLHGWVRNRDDGSVELEAEGEAAAVDALLAWARRGPDSARVESASVRVVTLTGADQGFAILR